MQPKIYKVACPTCHQGSQLHPTPYGAYRCEGCARDIAASDLEQVEIPQEKQVSCDAEYHENQAKELRSRCDVCGVSVIDMW